MNPSYQSFARNPGVSHRANPSIKQSNATGNLKIPLSLNTINTSSTDRIGKKKISVSSPANTVNLKNLLKKVRSKMRVRYNTNLFTYDKKVVTEIIYNEKSHVVAKFKDFLILDDLSEFLRRYYTKDESFSRIPKVTDYYENYSKIFPNYINLPEAKYIYKNIQRKQKLIDSQQRNANVEGKPNNNSILTKSKFVIEDKIFITDVYDSIMNQTETVLLEEQKTSNSNNSLEKLIGNIDKAEKKSEKSEKSENMKISQNLKITQNLKISENLNKKNTLINPTSHALNNFNSTTAAKILVAPSGDKTSSVIKKVYSPSVNKTNNFVNAVNSNNSNINTNSKHNVLSSTNSQPASSRTENIKNNNQTSSTSTSNMKNNIVKETNKIAVDKLNKPYKIKSLSPPKKIITSSNTSNTDRINKDTLTSAIHKLESLKLKTIDTILNTRTESKQEVKTNNYCNYNNSNLNNVGKVNTISQNNPNPYGNNNLLTSSINDEKKQFENKIFNKHKNTIELSMKKKNKNKLSTDFSNMTALKEKLKDTFERNQSGQYAINGSKLLASHHENSALNSIVPGNLNFLANVNGTIMHRQTKSTVPKMTNNIFYIINQNPQVNNQITIVNNQGNHGSNSSNVNSNNNPVSISETLMATIPSSMGGKPKEVIRGSTVISPEKKLAESLKHPSNTLRESCTITTNSISAASIFKMKKSTMGINNFTKKTGTVSSMFNKGRGTSAAGAFTSRKVENSKIGKVNIDGNHTNRDITPLNSSRQPSSSRGDTTYRVNLATPTPDISLSQARITINSKMFEKEILQNKLAQTRRPSPNVNKNNSQFKSNKTSLSPESTSKYFHIKNNFNNSNAQFNNHKKTNSNHLLDVKNKAAPFKPVIKQIVEKEINLEKYDNNRKIEKIQKIEKNGNSSVKENIGISTNTATTLKLSLQTKGIPIKNFNEILMRQTSINKGSNSDRSQVKKSDRINKKHK